MPNELLYIAAPVLVGVVIWINRRREAVSLQWRAGLMPKHIARRSKIVLEKDGIICEILKEDPLFDLKLANDQFHCSVPNLKLVCRDRVDLFGSITFKDIDGLLNRRDETAIILVVGSIDAKILTLSQNYNVPVIHPSDLPEFAKSLQRLMRGELANYCGSSGLLRVALAGSSVSRNDALAIRDLASSAEKQFDWQSAEQHWRSYLAICKNEWRPYVALANVLRLQERHNEAESIIVQAVRDLPSEPYLFAEYARLSEIKVDWLEALRRWDEVIARFPRLWLGYRGKIEALRKCDRHVEADELLATKALAFLSDGDALRDRAMHAEKTGNWREVEAIWRSFIALNSKVSWIQRELARSLRKQGKHAAAENILSCALTQFPAASELLIEAALCSEERGNLPEAQKRWQDVSAAEPGSPKGIIGECELLRRNLLLAEADKVIARALEIFPGIPDVHDAYGLNSMAAGAWLDALNRFDNARRLFPQAEIFVRRMSHLGERIAGSAIEQAGNGFIDQADLMLSKAVEILGDRDVLTIAKARVAEKRGVQSGLEAWAVVREKVTSQSIGYAAGAQVARKAGLPKQAADLLNEGNRRFPEDLALTIESGWYFYFLGDFQTAAVWWRQVRSIAPTELVGYLSGAITASRMRDFDGAEALFRESIALFPSHEPLVGLARLFQSRKKWNEAGKLWKEVRRLLPTNEEAYLSGIDALSASGQSAAACELLKDGLERFPDNQELWYRLPSTDMHPLEACTSGEKYATKHGSDD
jgi:tetratricopeptide (TPR) repeat protein